MSKIYVLKPFGLQEGKTSRLTQRGEVIDWDAGVHGDTAADFIHHGHALDHAGAVHLLQEAKKSKVPKDIEAAQKIVDSLAEPHAEIEKTEEPAEAHAAKAKK